MMERPFRNIEENLARIRERIAEAAVGAGRDPAEIRLMAVTKTQTPEAVNAAVACGVPLLGENRAQELNEKFDRYEKNGVEIHFIGHLQSNKARQIVDKVTMIHSVDSLKLAREIDRQCARLDQPGLERTMDVLIEVNIGGELSKSGVEPVEAEALAREIAVLPRLRLRGLMTIPPVCETEAEAEAYFSRMRQLQVDMQSKKIDNVSMDVLSMGMSDDYTAAVKHGATILRLGSAIFGPRDYTI